MGEGSVALNTEIREAEDEGRGRERGEGGASQLGKRRDDIHIMTCKTFI